MSDELAQAVRKMVLRFLAGLEPDRKVGKVTSASPLEVTFPAEDAGTVVAHKAAGYTPTVGDDVAVFRFGSTWVATYALEES